MSKKDEALKLALEALEKCDSALAEELTAWDIEPPLHHVLEASNACGPAITAIREALAEQPAQQQEPVAHTKAIAECLAVLRQLVKGKWPHEQALEELAGYTSPQPSKPWVGLEEQDMPDGEDSMYDDTRFIAGMVWANNKLLEKNA